MIKKSHKHISNPELLNSPDRLLIHHSQYSLNILDSVKKGHFNLRDHALRRCDHLSISRQNIMNIAMTCFLCRYQEEKYSYSFTGFLENERAGGFAAVINEGIWIVTVFKRRLSKYEKTQTEEKQEEFRWIYR